MNIPYYWREWGIRPAAAAGEKHLRDEVGHGVEAWKCAHNTENRTKWYNSKCKHNCVPYHKSVLENV